MENLELPHELKRVEHLLVFGPRPEPPVALRRRILGNVGAELRKNRILPRLRFATAFASIIVMWLSLSFGVSTLFAMQRSEQSTSIGEIAVRLQQLSPSLSREESLRQAVLRQIGTETNSQTPLGDIPSESECQ